MTCRALNANTLNVPFRMLFYATSNPARIFKVNLDGFEMTVIVTTHLWDVRSIAINHDKKRMCWVDTRKCNLSPKYWVRFSILAIMSVK